MNAIASALRNAYRGGGDQSVLEGIDLFQGKTPADRLRFFTTSNLIIRPGEPESDVKECEFFVGAPGAGELPALMRRLDPTRNKKPDEGGVVDVIAPNVLGLDFAYHDGVQWLSDWPEDSHGWPLAVRVRLVVLVGDEATYESAMATVPWDSAEVMTAWPISRVVNFPHWPKAGAAQPSQGGNDRNTTTQ